TAAAGPLPLFSAGRTTFIESPEAEFVRAPEEQARFRGGVHAWQDDASLQAASLDYSDTSQTAHAWGGTITRGLRRPANAPPVPVTIPAPEAFAEQKTGLVRYLGGALYTEPQGTLRAREIHVFRAQPPAGAPATAATDGRNPAGPAPAQQETVEA